MVFSNACFKDILIVELTVMDLVLLTQYFDTIKEMGLKAEKSTVFMPSSPSAVAGVLYMLLIAISRLTCL